MTPPDPIIVQKVTKQHLRRIYNDPRFQSELRKRTTQRVDVYEAPAPIEAGQAEGALSWVYDLYGVSGLLATVHQYRLRDGSIGASGRPDPIFLLVNGVPMVDP